MYVVRFHWVLALLIASSCAPDAAESGNISDAPLFHNDPHFVLNERGSMDCLNPVIAETIPVLCEHVALGLPRSYTKDTSSRVECIIARPIYFGDTLDDAPCEATEERAQPNTYAAEWVSSYNSIAGQANWVAARIAIEDVAGDTSRALGFRGDDYLPFDASLSISPRFLENTVYERGHLIPSSSRKSSRRANDATFLMSQVAPQAKSLNQGPWKTFEAYVNDRVREGYLKLKPVNDMHRERNEAVEDFEAFVYTGPILPRTLFGRCDGREGVPPSAECDALSIVKNRGKKRMVVPSGFFKIVIFATRRHDVAVWEPKHIDATIFQNNDAPGCFAYEKDATGAIRNVRYNRAPLGDIVRQTEYRFFDRGLPPEEGGITAPAPFDYRDQLETLERQILQKPPESPCESPGP